MLNIILPDHIFSKISTCVDSNCCEYDDILFLTLERIDCVHLDVFMVILRNLFSHHLVNELSLLFIWCDNTYRRYLLFQRILFASYLNFLYQFQANIYGCLTFTFIFIWFMIGSFTGEDNINKLHISFLQSLQVIWELSIEHKIAIF